MDAFFSTRNVNTTSPNAGMYAPPAADGPNSRQICGTAPDSLTWLLKMRPAWRRPGNISIWSVMRAPAGVHEIKQRDAQPPRRLLDADDLLDGARAPRAGLDGRVVGHDGDGPPVHATHARDDAVGGQVGRVRVREQAVLDEVLPGFVAQKGDALAAEQLAGGGVGLVILGRAALPDLLGEGLELVAA